MYIKKNILCLTCNIQRRIAAGGLACTVPGYAGVEPCVWLSAPPASYAQEEETPVRQHAGLHLSVLRWRVERVAIPQPLDGHRRAAFRPAGEPGRVPQFHHHVGGVEDDAGRRLLRTNSVSWENIEHLEKKATFPIRPLVFFSFPSCLRFTAENCAMRTNWCTSCIRYHVWCMISWILMRNVSIWSCST